MFFQCFVPWRVEISACRRRREPGHRISALAIDEHRSVIVMVFCVANSILSLSSGAPEKWVPPICLSGYGAPPGFKFSQDSERHGLEASIRTQHTLHETSLVMSLVYFVRKGYSMLLQWLQYGRVSSRVSRVVALQLRS